MDQSVTTGAADKAELKDKGLSPRDGVGLSTMDDEGGTALSAEASQAAQGNDGETESPIDIDTRKTQEARQGRVPTSTASAEGEKGEPARAQRSPGDAAAPTERKRQLRERIEARRNELEGALQRLTAANVVPEGKVLAISTALRGLDMHMGDHGEEIGEVQAAELALWLDNTRYLASIGDAMSEDGPRGADKAQAQPAPTEQDPATPNH